MDFLEEFLGTELYSQVKEKLKGNDKIKLANLATGEYVSKSKYEDDIKSRDEKINELTENVKKFDGVDVADLQQSVKDWETKYNEGIAAEKKNSAIKLAIGLSKPKNEKALMALIDQDIIKLDDKGELTGLKEQLDNLKKSDSYLFEDDKDHQDDQPSKNVNLGGNHDNKGGKDTPVSMQDAVSQYYDKGE